MKIRLFFLGVILVLASCIDQQLPDVDAIDVPAKDLNTKIALDAPSGWNRFRLSDAVALSIVNISADKIIFDPSYGARVFIYENGTWIETSNKLVPLESHDIILNPVSVDPQASGYTAILPDLVSESQKINMRIYITGYVYKENERTDEKVGAYIDVVLRR